MGDNTRPVAWGRVGLTVTQFEGGYKKEGLLKSRASTSGILSECEREQPMSQQRLFQFVTDLLPGWRKTLRRVLALGVGGLVERRRITLADTTRGMDSSTRILHRVKRLWRFLNNAAVDPREVVSALAQESFARRRAG